MQIIIRQEEDNEPTAPMRRFPPALQIARVACLRLAGLAAVCVVACAALAGAAGGSLAAAGAALAAARHYSIPPLHPGIVLDFVPAADRSSHEWAATTTRLRMRRRQAYDITVELMLEQLPCKGEAPVSTLELRLLREPAPEAVGVLSNGSALRAPVLVQRCVRAVVLPVRSQLYMSLASALALPGRLAWQQQPRGHEPPDAAHAYRVVVSCADGFTVHSTAQVPTAVSAILTTPQAGACAPRVSRAALTVTARLSAWQRLLVHRPVSSAALMIVSLASICVASCGCVFCTGLAAAVCVAARLNLARPAEEGRAVPAAPVSVNLAAGAVCEPPVETARDLLDAGRADSATLFGGDADNALRPWLGRRPS